jgi:hypothetical protein
MAARADHRTASVTDKLGATAAGGWIGSSFHRIHDPIQRIVLTQFRTGNRFPLFLELL